MRNKKALTLIELLIASTLVGVIVLAAFSIDRVARAYYISSVRSAELTNEANLVMETIAKSMAFAAGLNSVTVFDVPSTAGMPVGDVLTIMAADESTADLTDTVMHRYNEGSIGSTNHELVFGITRGATVLHTETLSLRMYDYSFEEELDPDGRLLSVKVGLVLRYDPDQPVDSSTNPELIMNSKFYPEQSSI